MEILFIYLGCLIFHANSQMTQCIDYKIKPIVNCQDYFSHCFILEGDDEDYTKLQHIDIQIIKPTFIIPQQEQPVVIKIIDTFDEKKKISEKLMCYLFRKLEYSIICISVELVYQDEQINFSEKFRFNTNIQATELCDEMNINEDGNFNMFCLSQFSLKQYTINISSRNASLISEFDIPNQIQDSCKIKYVKWNQNFYIVVFYQCSRWKVLLIKNNKVTTLLEAQMNDKETLFQGLSFINDVSFCVSKNLFVDIYLIENNQYIQVSINYSQQLYTYYFVFENIKRIQKIIVQQKCSIIFIVNPLEDDNSNVFNTQERKKLSLHQKYSNYKIYFHSNILFLQNSTELIAFLNPHLYPTFQIKSTPLHFFEIDKLFCQFDETQNAIQFYQYYQLSSLIKPKQKYLYIIQSSELFRINTLLLCLKMVNENNTKQQNLIQYITVQNQCQSKFQQTIQRSEVQNAFKNSSFNLYNQEGNISVSIGNNQIFLDSCLTKLQQFHIKTKIELRQLNIPDFIIFQNDNSFYIYSCKQNKLLVQINRNQFEVLEAKQTYFIVNKNTSNSLRIIQFKEGQLFQQKIQFDDVIINAQQFSKSIFLYINNKNLPTLIINSFEQKLDSKYLPKGLYQSEPILFYQEVGNEQFIQYLNIIAVENQGGIRFFKCQEGLIISVLASKISNQDFSMIAIQNVSNSLILTYFNDHEILQISNHTFSDYQFVFPFMYKINPQHLAILINKNNNTLYIAIFQYTQSSLELQDIIATDDSFFTFYQNSLLFTFNNELRYLLLSDILVQVETNSNFKYNLSSMYYFYPKIQEEDKDIQLKFQIQNNCYKLHALKNLTIFKIHQHQILRVNINDIFYGPINSLKLITNSSIILNGPFKFRNQLQQCNLNGSYICIKQFKIEGQLMFSTIFLENQVFEITIQPYSKIIYITNIKLSYYLWFFKKDVYLKIQLIYCTDKNINLILDLNDIFEIQFINAVDIVRTGNLIYIKDLFLQNYIYFEDTNFIEIKIPGNVLDIIYIEDSQDQYLTLQQKAITSIKYDLIIYQINLNQTNILYSISIFEELKLEVTNRQILIQELKLISCINIGSLIKIKMFMISNYYSYLYQLILDQQKNYIKFELQKQIRNSVSFSSEYEKTQIEQFNENILVLKIIQTNQFQYYDLREERNFYDYFYKSSYLMKIKQINTTHSIFINDSFVYLGTIGYEIELQNEQEINYNCQLHAQNDISDEKVLFQIHIIKQNNQFTKTNISIQFSSLIFIIIYLRNRQFRIQKQYKRKKHLQVIQIIDI
ncbi:unnamed protein product [Paramecium pentaurelia]|uniref:Transmembrane protein n=1 Tax=Paramecium pentaurelia TaxID=43138 RepID=A0A8S1XD19_9CILI|nr:unnamed protein product [Paramecium pentaurelia]